jgi:hypothetical protein
MFVDKRCKSLPGDIKNHIMEEEIRLTGIAIGYDHNLIYKCSNDDVIEEFKAYLDSTEVKRIDSINLWFEADGKVYFLKVKPEDTAKPYDSWIVTVNDNSIFTFRHRDGKNLLDEIEEQLRVHELSSHPHFG